MPGQRAPQSMEKAFRMSTEKAARPPQGRPPKPPRNDRAVMPASDDEPPRKKRLPRQRKPFRKLRLLFSLVVLAWFFVMGILVGRGTAPVSFDIDNLRNQLVTASAGVSERIAQIGGGSDETVDFYSSLGQDGADINIDDPRNYRPQYSVAPEGVNTAVADNAPVNGGEEQPVADGGDVVLGDAAYEGKTLAPLVKPKTEFDGYVALKSAGVQAITPPQATTQETPRQTPPAQTTQVTGNNANRGGSTVVAGGDVPQGSFSVQVAAVRGEAEAKAFLANLGQKGFSGRVEKTTVGEGVWYRVRVGVYQTRAQAEEDLQKLIKIGIKSPMIVTN